MIDESFSKEVICSLSRSTLTLKASKDPMAARFRALAERVETCAQARGIRVKGLADSYLLETSLFPGCFPGLSFSLSISLVQWTSLRGAGHRT